MARPSMRKAINDFCKSCIYDPHALGLGTWREQVKGCTSPNCALYGLRPMPADVTGGPETAANDAQTDAQSED